MLAITDVGGFQNIIRAIAQIADYVCIGAIMFSGISWMFGNRTRAMEHLLGACTGYLIVRKATILQQWLSLL